MLDEDVVDACVGLGKVPVPGIVQVGEELVEDAGAASGGDEAVEADGERLVRDAALAEQRGQDAEQREHVVRREEAGKWQEKRFPEPAGLGGGAAENGGGGAREPRAREADEERREGGRRVREAALGGGRVEEVERALRRGGGRDEAHELWVVEVPRRRRGGRGRWGRRGGRRAAGGAVVLERGDPGERRFGGRGRGSHGRRAVARLVSAVSAFTGTGRTGEAGTASGEKPDARGEAEEAAMGR